MSAVPIRRLEDLAGAIARGVAELLCAPVTVADAHGAIMADQSPDSVGTPNGAPGAEFLRVRFSLEGQPSEVIIGHPASGETVSPRLAQAIVDLVARQNAMAERLPDRHELKDRFIHGLLSGQLKEETEIQRESQILGVDLSRPRAVVLVDAAEYVLAAESSQASRRAPLGQQLMRARRVISSIVRFFHLPNESICAYIGQGEVAILKASTSQDLAAWTEDGSGPSGFHPSWANLSALKRAGEGLQAALQRDTGSSVSLGIGRYHPGVRGLERSYRDARAALSLGQRLYGPNRVHCLDGLGIAALAGLSEERTKIELALHLLGPLDHEPDLLATLDAFFAENCCPSSTAARLWIHRNTLAYRLEKITSLIGLDPRRFDDAVQIRLALVLRALQKPAADCADAQ